MLPTLEKYDGQGDLEEHLRSFADTMTIYSPVERGVGVVSFSSSQTIESFVTLRRLFEQ